MKSTIKVHPTLLGILGVVMIASTSLVFTYVCVYPLDLSTLSDSILGRIAPRELSMMLIDHKFELRVGAWISIAISMGFLMIVYRYREKQKQFQFWPLGMFYLGVIMGCLWLVFTTYG